MRPNPQTRRLPFILLFVLSAALICNAQAPPSLQFFMPDGSLPSREVRFTMAMDNGRIEVFFTDSKGKFLMTRLQGLRPDAGYTITVESDGTTFDTTTITFKEFGVYYIPVFLRPLKSRAPQPARTVDLAEFDAHVPEAAQQSYQSAMRAIRDGRGEEAIRELERAVTVYPVYFRALNDLGVIYMKLNRLDDATLMFERAIKIGPRVFYPRLNLAIIQTRQGKYKEAVEALQKLQGEYPMLAEVRVALGDVLMALDRLNEAEPHLRMALTELKLERDAEADAHYKLGLLLNRKQKFEEAVKELTIAVGVLPNSARVHLQLGGALLQVKRLDDAERELLAAYKLGGAQMGGAQLMLGEIYFMQKKYQNAARAFEQYLADVPQAPNAAEVRAVIEKIKAALRQK